MPCSTFVLSTLSFSNLSTKRHIIFTIFLVLIEKFNETSQHITYSLAKSKKNIARFLRDFQTKCCLFVNKDFPDSFSLFTNLYFLGVTPLYASPFDVEPSRSLINSSSFSSNCDQIWKVIDHLGTSYLRTFYFYCYS